MEAKSMHARHRRQVFFVACGAVLVILAGFAVTNYIGRNLPAMWVNIAMALVVAGGALGLRLGIDDLRSYRMVCWGAGVGLLCLAWLGPNYLYYHLVMPLLMFFFLGKREGMILSGAFFLGMAVLLLAPGVSGGNTYQVEQGLRFLVGYLFVSLVGWGHEKWRQRLYALLETVFNTMEDGILIVDATGRQLFHNPSAERIGGSGKTPLELSELAEIYGIFYPDKVTHVRMEDNPLVRAMRGESTEGFEAFVRNREKPDGVHVNATGQAIRDQETGKVEFAMVIFRDITKYKEAEEQLEQTVSELGDRTQLMETIFNTMEEGVVVSDAEGQMLFFNSSAERILGMGTVESKPDDWSETYGAYHLDKKTLVPHDQLPLVRALRGEVTDEMEVFVRNDKKPEGVFVSATGRFIPSDEDADTSNKVRAGVVVFSDITKYREQEAQLRETIARLQKQSQLMETVFKSVSDGVVVTGKDGEFLFVNPSAERISGMGPTEGSSDQWAEIYGTFYPDKKTPYPSHELPLVRAMKGESLDEVELFLRNPERPEGVSISVSARPLKDDSGMIEGGVIVLRDVTKLKAAESELRQTVRDLRTQKHAMETVFNSISDGVVVADETGKFTIFNPSAERIVGIGMTDTGPDQWSDRYGIFFPDRQTPFPIEELPLVRAIHGEPSDEVEMFVRNPNIPDGVYISVSGRPLRADGDSGKGGVIVFRDVTERMLADESLAQAFAQGKLEIVDTILHNIGNAINSVSIGVGTIREQLVQNGLVNRLTALAEAVEAHREDRISYLQTDPQGRKVIPFLIALAKDFAEQNVQHEQIVRRVESRVAHIVDIIRTQRTLDSGAMVRKDVNLRKAIADAVRLLQESLAKREIEIRIDCRKAPEEIRIQESKFHQMLVNLIKNSAEAIDDLQKSGGLETKPCIRIQCYAQEDFFVLDVIDNGIGIEEKRFKTVFTAGYTTKKTGSGLGLHSIANFVIGSGGQIYPLSEGSGKGTTMRVKLRLVSVAVKSGN